MKRIGCPKCGRQTNYSPSAARLHPQGHVFCELCGEEIDPGQKKRDIDSILRSRDQETKAAKRYGGRRQPGSGSSKRAKSDFVDQGRIRGECKFTRAKTYILKLEELMKLEKEATSMEMPLFEIQFQGVHPPKTFVVLPAEWYQYLLQKAENAEEEEKEDND